MNLEQARIDRQEWWNWGASLVVTWLLTFAVAVLALTLFARPAETAFHAALGQATRSLIPAILIFNLYSFHQRILFLSLRRKVARQTSRVEESEAKARDLYELAVRDALTGLPNRRLADERLFCEVARAKRHHSALSILLIDLDGFKTVNDRFGHPVGDSLLRAFSRDLMATVRAEDLVARVGGDEFLMILPNCPAENVPVFLARIPRTTISVAAETIPCLYSVGWATARPDDNSETLVARADRCLYEMKKENPSTHVRQRSHSSASDSPSPICVMPNNERKRHGHPRN